METLQRTANRGSISTGFNINNSVKLEADNTEYFSRTPSSATNRQTFTFSTWIKRTELGQNARVIDVHSNGQNFTTFGFDTSDRIVLYAIDGGVDYGGHYTRRFRDTSAWYHMVWKSDITNSTAANRWQIYVNGVEVTGKDTDYGTPPTNFYTLIDTATAHKIGYNTDGSNGSSQYMAETHFVDGQALAPTAFGEFDDDTGIWKPIEVDVTYGTNGFYLDYADASDLGDDESGNGNDFTETNITAADQATDTPTNNFCTMNPLKGPLISFVNGTASNPRIPLMTEGATVLGNNANTYSYAEATMGVTSGKWYWEMKPTVDASTNVSGAGIATNINKGFYSTDGTGNFFWHMAGNRYVNGASSGYGAAWATNDILGFAYDADNWTLTCYKNNSSQGNVLASQADLSAEIVIPYMYSYGTHTYQWNFGGYHVNSLSSAASDANGYGSFEYAPPSGYYALCTKNLAEYG